jgi:hypothetical protein
MNVWRKWTIARRLDAVNGAKPRGLPVETPEHQGYQQSLRELEERLRAGAAELRQASAPPYLAPRIMESVRETTRSSRASRTSAGSVWGAEWTWRPLWGIAGAASLAAAVMLLMTLISPSHTTPQAQSEGTEAHAPAPAVTILAANQVEPPLTLDPSDALVPAGRRVIERVGSPLVTEAELLRRDAQVATETVISSLPFGGGGLR